MVSDLRKLPTCARVSQGATSRASVNTHAHQWNEKGPWHHNYEMSSNQSRTALFTAERETERISRQDICLLFEICTRTYQCILKNIEKLEDQARKDCPTHTKKLFSPKYPAILAQLERFVSYARNFCLPVTSNLMQYRAQISATSRG